MSDGDQSLGTDGLQNEVNQAEAFGGQAVQNNIDLKAGLFLQSYAAAQALKAPWQIASFNPSRFFFPMTIAADRWDKLYPYRLVVIDTTNNNWIVNGSSNNADINIVNAGQNGNFTITFQALNPQWQIQLPITPEQLNITDQYAITTSATLRGVMEEHNGVKFKNISASGTFGVWPSRPNLTTPPGTPSVLQSLFGGTIEAFGNVVSSVQSVARVASGGSAAPKPKTIRPESANSAGLTSTGYYQALAVQQFIEQYVEAKKRPENAGWRLVFDIPKQNQSFVVTPVQFVWQQSIAKPMQVNYTMQLKAWRRIDLKESVQAKAPSVQTISPGILQRIMNTIAAARQATSTALSLIAAVTTDVEAPLEALRQTSLLVKDLAGVAVTAADLPYQLQTDFKSAIGDVLNNLQSINGLPTAVSSNPAVASAFSALKASYAQNEGLSINAVTGGQLGTPSANQSSIDPALNIFSNPAANYAFIDQAPLNNMVLDTAQQNAVDNAIIAAQSLTTADLKNFRATIQQLAILLSNNFGTGSAYYNQVYGLPPPATRITPISLDNYDLLTSLYDVMQSYDILTATTDINDAQILSNMEYVAGLATASGIDFTIPNSKILAPVPFGLTIEAISARYLGDPQRWIEIATLNDLKDPYIDESGFQYPLLSNANGRQITISNNYNLYLGQVVTLMSATQTPSARKILDIQTLSDTSYLITLDGLPNLNNFVIADQAYIQVYLPGTVNSQQKIFIPSTQIVPDSPTIIVPASTSVDPLTGLSQVDLLLTDNGDLAVNNFGDFRYAYGMTNIVQALRIKLGTQVGTVLLHPEFGLTVKPGISASSVNAQQIYSSLNTLIQQDPRFAGLSSLVVNLQGPVLTINMAVILANNGGVFPVSYIVTSGN